MKLSTCLLVFFISTVYCFSQERQYIEKTGDTISRAEFIKKIREEKLPLSTWRYIGKDGKTYSEIKNDLYLVGRIDYETVIKELNKLIPQNITDSTTIILEFRYKDDLCNSNLDNNWTRGEINMRKSFTNPIKRKINKKDILFFHLFEKGITLKNKPGSKNEYYFSDKENFFRNAIFTSRATCGSFAAVKTNDELLIRNGEYRGDNFAEHLKPENWYQFFKDN